jgi:hypothetical protein
MKNYLFLFLISFFFIYCKKKTRNTDCDIIGVEVSVKGQTVEQHIVADIQGNKITLKIPDDVDLRAIQPKIRLRKPTADVFPYLQYITDYSKPLNIRVSYGENTADYILEVVQLSTNTEFQPAPIWQNATEQNFRLEKMGLDTSTNIEQYHFFADQKPNMFKLKPLHEKTLVDIKEIKEGLWEAILTPEAGHLYQKKILFSSPFDEDFLAIKSYSVEMYRMVLPGFSSYKTIYATNEIAGEFKDNEIILKLDENFYLNSVPTTVSLHKPARFLCKESGDTIYKERDISEPFKMGYYHLPNPFCYLEKNDKKKNYRVSIVRVNLSVEINQFECDRVRCYHRIVDDKIVVSPDTKYKDLKIIPREKTTKAHCDKQSDHFKCTLTPAGYPEYAVTQLIYWNE